MPHLRLPGLALAALLTTTVLAPATAHADAVALGLKGNRLDVAMTADGAAHVARLLPTSPKPTLTVCRIPAGGTTCTPTASTTLPRENATGPWVLAQGNKVVVAAGSSDGASEGTYTMVAPEGLAYGQLSVAASITATDVELSPDGQRLYVSATRGPMGSPQDFAAFSSVPTSGAPAAVAVLGSASGSRSLSAPLVAVRPDGRPLTLLSGSGPGLVTGNSFYTFIGASPIDAAFNSKAGWSAPTPFDLPAPSVQNGDYEAVSAPGALWLAYEALGTDVLLRRWENDGFGPALSPDCRRPSRFAAGSQQAPALAVSRTGDLQLAYVGSDTTNKHLVYFRGNADGTAFSAYQELYTGPDDQEDVEIASDPTSDTGGIVVWTSDAIYADKGELKFARLPQTALVPCEVPKAEIPTEPITTGQPTKPTPPKAKPPKLTTVVRGLPSLKRCVSRRSFTIRLRHPKGTRIASAAVKVNGHKVATRKGKRVTAPVNLRGLPKGTYKVSITVKLSDGRTVSGVRRYTTCAKRRAR